MKPVTSLLPLLPLSFWNVGNSAACPVSPYHPNYVDKFDYKDQQQNASFLYLIMHLYCFQLQKEHYTSTWTGLMIRLV